MIRQLLVVGVLLTFSLALVGGQVAEQPKTKPAGDIFAANKKLGRGINLGNALDAPTEGAWGVTLKADYFKTIKAAGFDSVRLPVKWSNHAQKDAPYTIDAKFAQRVDWAIDQALANNLNIVVNVHHYDQMDAGPDKNLPRLIGLWEQIARRLKDRPPQVYIELYNEPHDKLTEAKWNEALAQLIPVVRQTNPTRPIIVGPAQWNAIRALDQLKLPPDDHNLILTVHFYDPFHFTHQGASWVGGADKWKGTHWTGTKAEQSEIRKSLDTAAAWARKHDRPVFLGEFGSLDKADMDSRATWTRFVTREAEARGFSWSYWEFCSSFGAYDPTTDAWRGPLKAALVK